MNMDFLKGKASGHCGEVEIHCGTHPFD